MHVVRASSASPHYMRATKVSHEENEDYKVLYLKERAEWKAKMK